MLTPSVSGSIRISWAPSPGIVGIVRRRGTSVHGPAPSRNPVRAGPLVKRATAVTRR